MLYGVHDIHNTIFAQPSRCTARIRVYIFIYYLFYMTSSIPSASEFPTYIRRLRVYVYILLLLLLYPSVIRLAQIYLILYYNMHCISRLIANRNKCCECDVNTYIRVNFYSNSINYYWHYDVYREFSHMELTSLKKKPQRNHNCIAASTKYPWLRNA